MRTSTAAVSPREAPALGRKAPFASPLKLQGRHGAHSLHSPFFNEGGVCVAAYIFWLGGYHAFMPKVPDKNSRQLLPVHLTIRLEGTVPIPCYNAVFIGPCHSFCIILPFRHISKGIAVPAGDSRGLPGGPVQESGKLAPGHLIRREKTALACSQHNALCRHLVHRVEIPVCGKNIAEHISQRGIGKFDRPAGKETLSRRVGRGHCPGLYRHRPGVKLFPAAVLRPGQGIMDLGALLHPFHSEQAVFQAQHRGEGCGLGNLLFHSLTAAAVHVIGGAGPDGTRPSNCERAGIEAALLV